MYREIQETRELLITWSKSAGWDIEINLSPIGLIRRMRSLHCDERSYADLALSGGILPLGGVSPEFGGPERLAQAARKYIAAHRLMRCRFQDANDAVTYQDAERELLEEIERIDSASEGGAQ